MEEVRVVVVDDMPDAARTIASLLEFDGYHVEIALDGWLALEVIERTQPHCVMLDIAMPGFDGTRLARHLRSRFRDDIVLIAMTGWDKSDPRVAECLEIVDHYFLKPVDIAELHKVLPPLHR